MIDLRMLNIPTIQITTTKRPVVGKLVCRVIHFALFAIKVLQLIFRTMRGDASTYYFFHSHVMLFVVTGVFYASAVINTSDEAVAYFNYHHFVCRKFLGKYIFLFTVVSVSSLHKLLCLQAQIKSRKRPSWGIERM